MIQLRSVLFSLIVPLALSAEGGNLQTNDLKENTLNISDQRGLRSPLNQQNAESQQFDVKHHIYVKDVNTHFFTSSNALNRKLLSWASVFKFVLHPPHPPHPHHQNGGGSSGGSGGSSGGSSSGGSSSGGSSSGGSSSGGSSSGGSSSGTSAATSNSGGSSGGSSSGTTSGATSDGEGSGVTSGSRATSFGSSAASITMFVVAAAAAGAAIGAVVFGRKQHSVTNAHPLRGGLNKRITLFSNFAQAPSTNVDRPDRLVEMTSNGNESDYVRA